MVDAEIFASLLAQVQESKQAYQDAKERFWEIARKCRLANPAHPDGSEILRRAFIEENIALSDYYAAMTRLNRYLLDGMIPPDVTH